jgi:ABC-type bacteriocin/lantibiotic exporter with double-glycine peptidase domain
VLLLGINHRQQRRKADCLVACAAMVLDYLGVAVAETRLRRRLGTTDNGTPFPNLERLQALGLFVQLAKQGELSLFERNLALGLPVIVSVETFGWRHWAGEVTRHAVVVVGIDQEHGVIYIHDPFFADAPFAMDLTEFMIGWEERERHYAVIGLASPEDQT